MDEDELLDSLIIHKRLSEDYVDDHDWDDSLELYQDLIEDGRLLEHIKVGASVDGLLYQLSNPESLKSVVGICLEVEDHLKRKIQLFKDSIAATEGMIARIESAQRLVSKYRGMKSVFGWVKSETSTAWPKTNYVGSSPCEMIQAASLYQSTRGFDSRYTEMSIENIQAITSNMPCTTEPSYVSFVYNLERGEPRFSIALMSDRNLGESNFSHRYSCRLNTDRERLYSDRYWLGNTPDAKCLMILSPTAADAPSLFGVEAIYHVP